MLPPRELDHSGADVDAHALRRLERGEHVARTAADLEHAAAGRDVEAHDLLDEAVVEAVAAPPPRFLEGERVEEGPEVVRDRALGLRRLDYCHWTSPRRSSTTRQRKAMRAASGDNAPSSARTGLASLAGRMGRRRQPPDSG